MNLRQTIRLLGGCPADYLDTECPLSLGAFLFGYKCADASAGLVMVELLRRIPGPDQWDGCTRAYLEYGPGTNGFRRTFEIVQEVVAELQPQPSAGMYAEYAFIDIVRGPIASGRTGLVLGEPTIVWLATFYRGFLAGLESVAPHAARGATASLHRFEVWLRDRYQQPRSCWHAIIRAFEGEGMRGLQRFVALWDECESSSYLSGRAMTSLPPTDAVGFVKSHPEMFFPGAMPSANVCAQQLVGEVLSLGAADVTVERHEDWWIVSSSLDWFLPDQTADEQLRRLLPFPQAGANASRVEVVLVAFAESVATLTAGQEWRSLSGPEPTKDLGGRRMCQVGRAVAFRFPVSGIGILNTVTIGAQPTPPP